MDKTNISPKELSKSLRKYAPEELEKTLRGVKEAYEMGLIQSTDLDQFLVDFKFRDAALRYWTIGIQTEKWYCSSRTGWVEAARPSERLEALSDLKLTQTFSVKDLTANEETENTPPPPPPSPPNVTPSQQPTYVGVTKPQSLRGHFCTNCGRSLEPNDKFCNNCGTRVE